MNFDLNHRLYRILDEHHFDTKLGTPWRLGAGEGNRRAERRRSIRSKMHDLTLRV
jgi:hypothetical protein